MGCASAVWLVFESGRPVAQVACDLGVHEALRHWVRQASDRHDRLTTSERERMKTLERELRKANEILKAASASRSST